MDKRDFFGSLYKDFLGIEKENEKLANDIDNLPKIEVIQDIKTNSEETKVYSDEEIGEMIKKQMVNLQERIDQLYVTKESKEKLVKMIEYIKRYHEGKETEFICFNTCIYPENLHTTNEIAAILSDAMTFFSYIKKGNLVEVSLYNVEKSEQLDKLYTAKNSVIVMRDMQGFFAQDNMFQDKLIHQMAQKISANEKQFLTILSFETEESYKRFFEKNEDIKQKHFRYEIIAEKPETEEIYEMISNKLEKENELTDGFKVKLHEYIAATYPNAEVSSMDYVDQIYEAIIFHKNGAITEDDVPEYEQEKTMEEIFAELNDLVGLENVKQVLQDLVSLIELKQKTKDQLKIKDTNLHMVFLGNPGTGKTTVARIVAQILYHLKYTKQNKLIEVSSKDLVAEYVGQTGPKTMAVIEKAMGGVLFIDEAYSLASGNGQGNSYNEEAIATLIQAMENYRDNLVVVFAGYTKEMQAFLNANSGIVSRIGYTLNFEDYTKEQLLQIFESMLKKAGFSAQKSALDKALSVIEEYKDTENFGNARFVRSLYEKTIIKHASRTKGKTGKKLLTTITEEDINVDNLLKM